MSKRTVTIEVGTKTYSIECTTRMLIAIERRLKRPAMAILSEWRGIDEESVLGVSAADVYSIIATALSFGDTKPKNKALEDAFDDKGILGYFGAAVKVLSTCVTGDNTAAEIDEDDDEDEAKGDQSDPLPSEDAADEPETILG